jgi:hypothetical protein
MVLSSTSRHAVVRCVPHGLGGQLALDAQSPAAQAPLPLFANLHGQALVLGLALPALTAIMGQL